MLTNTSSAERPADTFSGRSSSGGSVLTVCAVVPAYNEAERIRAVLDAVAGAAQVDEIVVVDDGSSDDTQATASAHPAAKAGKLRVIRLPANRGKGAAMREGAEAAHADALVFLDADLIGLTAAHVDALVEPVTRGAVMSLGVFRHGRGPTDLAQKLVPNISGQRAIRRDVFLSIPCLTKSGFGVELAITHFIADAGLPMKRVVLEGVTHPMKEEKLGFLRGARARLRMYRQMLPYMLRRSSRRLRKPKQES